MGKSIKSLKEKRMGGGQARTSAGNGWGGALVGGQWAAGGVSERRTWKGLLREWRMRTATERTALQIAARKSGHPVPKVAPRRRI